MERLDTLMLSLLIVVTSSAFSASFAADSVTIRSKDSDNLTQYTGSVLDYTGRFLRIELEGGLERTFPSSRVAEVQGDWSAEHRAAIEASAEGDYRAAIARYRRAIDNEPREWVRREILAELTWLYSYTGETTIACELFMLLTESDPETPYFDAIPLAWMPSEDVRQPQALGWLGQEGDPVAMLLGASHLLSTTERPAALEALKKLATSGDERISSLARAQTWRSVAFRATDSELAQWLQQVESMPESLRAGAYFVLGNGLKSRKRLNDAALAWLRVPVLYPKHRALAGEALASAGGALEQLERPTEAERLYRELARRFPETEAARQRGLRREE